MAERHSPKHAQGRFGGMTVNERLFAAGLLADFDAARKDWDEVALRRIFVAVELPDYDLELLRNAP